MTALERLHCNTHTQYYSVKGFILKVKNNIEQPHSAAAKKYWKNFYITVNNFVFEINLYFFPNGNIWKESTTVSDSILKFSRRDLQILAGVFLMDILILFQDFI